MLRQSRRPPSEPKEAEPCKHRLREAALALDDETALVLDNEKALLLDEETALVLNEGMEPRGQCRGNGAHP